MSSLKFLALAALVTTTAVAAETAKPAAPNADTMKRGQAVYSRTCIACHQPTGMGIPPVFPPLAGSEWVAMDASVAVRNIVQGMVGPVTVKGATYNGMMPPVAGVTDKDIADVDHLITCFKEDYKLTKDWDGDLYGGIKFKWDYEARMLDISMLGYIAKQL